MIDPDYLDTGWDDDSDEALERIWKQEDQYYERYQKQRKNLKYQKGTRMEESDAWKKQQNQRQKYDYTDRTGNSNQGYMQWEDVSE